MRYQSFTQPTLAQMFRDEDFYLNPILGRNEKIRKLFIEKATETAEKGVIPLDLSVSKKGNKTVFGVKRLSQKLVLRKAAQNLIKTTDSRSVSRSQIVSELLPFLEEGNPYRIYRLDIGKCFESFPYDYVVSILRNNSRLSPQTKVIIEECISYFFYWHRVAVPRGIEFSPALANACLKSFDRSVAKISEVVFYARFVDDILIVTNGQEGDKDLVSEVSDYLPSGMKFNEGKEKIIDVDKRTNGSHGQDKPYEKFSYLGYSFEVTDRWNNDKNKGLKSKRDLRVTLSDDKIKSLKTKIFRAFWFFRMDRDFHLLEDRLLYLTTNRITRRSRNQQWINSGIYYNYSHINDYSALRELDSFLRACVLVRTGRSFSRLPNFSNKTKNRLLRISFCKGFEQKIFREFSLYRESVIKEAWKW